MNLTINKKWIIIISISVLTVCCLYYFFMDKPVKSEVVRMEMEEVNTKEFEETISLDEEEAVGKEDESSSIVIDIKGAVQKPGVYEIFQGARVFEVIQKAGGLSENADELAVNLASPLQDGMVVYIPLKGETTENPFIDQIAEKGDDPAQQKVNINMATSEELQTLTGIGPSKAEAIIAYREEKGPFTKNEDLLEVTGIGEKSFEKLREEITVK